MKHKKIGKSDMIKKKLNTTTSCTNILANKAVYVCMYVK